MITPTASWFQAHRAAATLAAATALGITTVLLDSTTIDLPSLLAGMTPAPVATFTALMCASLLLLLTRRLPLEDTALRPLTAYELLCVYGTLLCCATISLATHRTGAGLTILLTVIGLTLLLRTTTTVTRAAVATTTLILTTVALRPPDPATPQAPWWAPHLDLSLHPHTWIVSLGLLTTATTALALTSRTREQHDTSKSP